MNMNSIHVPKQLCGASILFVLIKLFITDFGNSPVQSGGRYRSAEIIGVLLPLMVLIIPIFIKKFRSNYWTKENIIITFIFLFINSFLLVFMKYNAYNYYQDNGWDISIWQLI